MRTLLIVEDEWAIADWLQALLGDEGYDVLLASNGKQALEVMALHTPELIITDFMMPILDGPGLLKKLSENAVLSAIPVVVMSSLDEETVRERCDGYKAFLRKPFREDDLLSTITRTLDGK